MPPRAPSQLARNRVGHHPDKEVNSRSESPYLQQYHHFRTDLRMLEWLNMRLPKAITRIVNKERIVLRQKAGQHQIKRLIDLLDESLKLLEKPVGSKSSIQFSDETVKLLMKFAEQKMFENRGTMFIRDMSLVYLIATYEIFLGEILSILFEGRPEALKSTCKELTTEELIMCKDIRTVIRRISEREVELVIHQDVEETRMYFKDRLGVDLRQFTNWREFSERFYRRNIIVHNSGMTNEIYRRKTGYKGKDKHIGVSQAYLIESIQLFESTAKKISEHFQLKFG